VDSAPEARLLATLEPPDGVVRTRLSTRAVCAYARREKRICVGYTMLWQRAPVALPIFCSAENLAHSLLEHHEEGNAPIIYIARGSHGSYERPGSHYLGGG
jgi:hypothetical protein